MFAATQSKINTTTPLWRWSGHAFLLGALLLAATLVRGQGVAQPAGDKDVAQAENEVAVGWFITVRNPLDSDEANRIKAEVHRFLDGRNPRGCKIVLDFNPEGLPRKTGDYGTCHDLAEFFLHEPIVQPPVTTIAFVRNDVTGHNVLPVLACREVVMAKTARIGDALAGESSQTLRPDKRVFYETVAEARRYFPAIVLKLVDPKIEVLEGTRDGGPCYVYRQGGVQEAKAGFVQTRPEPLFPAGKTALYEATQAEKLGLCKIQLDTLTELGERYGLSSLREDPLQGRDPKASRIVLSGPVNRSLKEKLQPRIQRAIHKGANLIIVQLECSGGDTEVAQELAEFFRTLRDDQNRHSVMTVAYVTERAHAPATSIALGCSDIVMDQKAYLGLYDRILQERPNYVEAISKPLEELAEKKGYSPLLVRGMFDRHLAIHRVHRQGKVHERRLMDARMLDEDQKDKAQWVNDEQIKAPGELLKVDSRLAGKLGLAKDVFDGPPGEATAWLKKLYGVKELPEVATGWLDDLATFLCHPGVSSLLVIIGIAGLILELKVPGIGLPGVVAAICFVLYFWAHSQMAGHLTMLAVLLFLLGLILIGLEVFVVPGLGVTGISGIVLLIVSLALVTLVKKPETTHEWMDFATTLATLGLSLVVAVGGALTLAWYLPHIPWANRLILTPPGEPVLGDGGLAEETISTEGLATLLGAMGEAMTPLRPAGKARFGEEFVDVVAEGSYVAPGARVQVIEIEGNRIVVKEV
jgi:membrane-bound ClpP family serine protease